MMNMTNMTNISNYKFVFSYLSGVSDTDEHEMTNVDELAIFVGKSDSVFNLFPSLIYMFHPLGISDTTILNPSMPLELRW